MQFKTLHNTHKSTDTSQSNSNSGTLAQSHSLPDNTDTVTQSFMKEPASKKPSNNNRKSKTVRVSLQALDVIWLIVAEYRCSLKDAVDVMAKQYRANTVTESQSQKVSERSTHQNHHVTLMSMSPKRSSNR